MNIFKPSAQRMHISIIFEMLQIGDVVGGGGGALGVDCSGGGSDLAGRWRLLRGAQSLAAEFRVCQCLLESLRISPRVCQSLSQGVSESVRVSQSLPESVSQSLSETLSLSLPLV